MNTRRHDSEKYIERKLADMVKAKGGLCVKLLCDQYAGLPDRLCLLPEGKMCFVEVKSRGEKPRRLQDVVHGRLRALGFHVFVIDSVEMIKKVAEI